MANILKHFFFHCCSKFPVEQPCAIYGGIVNSIGTACCASDCSKCDECTARAECCYPKIPKEQICGVSGQMAPCHLFLSNKYSQLI